MDKPQFNENNIVEALMGAAAFRSNDNLREVVIQRGDRELFRFKIHGVDEDTVNKCRKLATKNRGRRDETVDWLRNAANLIYEATVDDDKQRFWNNREVWQKLDCVTGSDVVMKCLTPAERAKIVEVIENISGYDDNGLDDFIKNV